MPFLNWRDHSLNLKMFHKSEQHTQLELTLTQVRVDELLVELLEIFPAQGTPSGRELRLALPQNWTLFLKARTDGARFLLAHPAPDEWVGTLALDPIWGQKLTCALPQLSVARELSLRGLGIAHSVSNFDLVLRWT